MNTGELQAQIAGTQSISLSNSAERYNSAEPGLPLLVVDSPLCQGVLSPYGAQLLEFKAKNSAPLLWLSPNAVFKQGVPIRGGVPICAPWFGPHPTDSHKPNHGFARNNHWALKTIQELPGGEVILDFLFDTEEVDTETYGYRFKMLLSITLGDAITLELSVQNEGEDELPVTWAFHTYFAINDLNATRVTGLTGKEYIDQTNALTVERQECDITFTKEVDRVYQAIGETQSIQCDHEQATLANIMGKGCPSAIVWNPHEQLAAKMKDVGGEGYQQFVCVERGAVFDDSWRIVPKETMTATLKLSS